MNIYGNNVLLIGHQNDLKLWQETLIASFGLGFTLKILLKRCRHTKHKIKILYYFSFLFLNDMVTDDIDLL